MNNRLMAALASAALITAPTVAAAAPANPAASLSVAKSVRVSAPAGKDKLAGGTGGIFAIGVFAGVIAILAVAFANDRDDSDSN